MLYVNVLAALGVPGSSPGALTAQQAPHTITCDPSDPGNCMCDGVPIGPSTYTQPKWLNTGIKSIYNTSALMNGVPTPLANYRAPVTIVTNVASA